MHTVFYSVKCWETNAPVCVPSCFKWSMISVVIEHNEMGVFLMQGVRDIDSSTAHAPKVLIKRPFH